jgi:hypothetical protein
MEARRREPPNDVDPRTFPHADIEITERFLRDHEPALLYLSVHLMKAALEIPNVVDADIRDALAAMVKTYRTMQSGLIYSSRPDNMLAAAICDRMQAAVDDLRKRIAEQAGMQTVRDADILGVLAFLQRMEIQQNNGRRLGRAFLDFLREQFPPVPEQETKSSLIV